MFWGARWSRKKSEEFKSTCAAQDQRNKLDGKPLLEQLKAKETWDKVNDGIRFHDPRSDKAKAIKYDLIGTLGKVPFAIVTLITVVIFVFAIYLSI